TYSLLWLMKQSMYPDRRFEIRRPVWIGFFFVFLPLAGYYIAPYLLASRHPSLPAPIIAGIVSIYIFGVYFHYVGDAQKYFTLRAGPALITDGLFSRVRNPNYLGEILIYCAFAALSAHWLPFVIVAAWSAFFFIPGARAKATPKDYRFRSVPSVRSYNSIPGGMCRP
ncbi:DUF1295 domain-containing protein, partial [Bradyrhizobium sp.]|uniref:DUF1295 domain-containing protein n=1 Tax=Bradyrhizobium sp. TaxID=376 RepID=UPI003C7308EE